jgi:hypothetical protein
MNHRWPSIFLRDGGFFAVSIGGALFLARQEALAAPLPQLENRAKTALLYFLLSGALAFIYCLPKSDSARWKKSLSASAFMVIASSLMYSMLRQEIVLVPLTALFYLPGASMGSAITYLQKKPVAEIESLTCVGLKDD